LINSVATEEKLQSID